MTYNQVNKDLIQEDGKVAKKYVWNSESDEEHVRLREQHEILLKLVDGRYYLAPMKEPPRSVLELATGTGVWAAEFASLHPETSILGVDYVNALEDGMPPNFSFKNLDLTTEDWDLGQQFDFVHGKLLFAIPLDFERLVAQAFQATKPGGWYECKEYLIPPRCANDWDGTAYKEWSEAFMQGLAAIGQDWTVASRLDEYMRRAGFVDVRYESFQLPMGGWPEDPKMREVGEWYGRYTKAYEPIYHIAFGKGLGWETERIDKLIQDIRNELAVTKKVHGWHEYRVIYGRRPE